MIQTNSNDKANGLLEKLRKIIDPDLGVSIIDLGMVYDLKVNRDLVNVEMTLTSPGCPYGHLLISQVEQQIIEEPDIKKVNVNLVWNPPWSEDRMSEELKWAMDL